MIVSFADRDTQALFDRKPIRRLDSRIHSLARRKLLMLDAAFHLADLRSPPGNRLEALRGNLAGRHSIRINDQWRIIFIWRNGNAHRSPSLTTTERTQRTSHAPQTHLQSRLRSAPPHPSG